MQLRRHLARLRQTNDVRPKSLAIIRWFLVVAAIVISGEKARGDVLVSSLGQHAVLQYRDDGTFVRTVVASGGGGLERPFGLLVIGDELLVVDDALQPAVRRYDFATGDYLGTLIDNSEPGTLNAPDDLLLTNTGELLLSNYFGSNVSRFDAATGDLKGRFTVGRENALPSGMALDSSGELLVADRTGALWRYRWQDGTLLQSVLPGQGGIVDLTFDRVGDILATNRKSVLRIDAVTGEFHGVFGDTDNVGDTFGLGQLPDGDLLVTLRATGAVLRFDGETGESKGSFIAAGQVQEPTYLLHVEAVPEPSSLALLAAGAAGLAALRAKRNRSAYGQT